MAKRRIVRNYVVSFPQLIGHPYLGYQELVYGVVEAVHFSTPFMARKWMWRTAYKWAQKIPGEPVFEKLPVLRQPIPGSEHGPVRLIDPATMTPVEE